MSSCGTGPARRRGLGRTRWALLLVSGVFLAATLVMLLLGADPAGAQGAVMSLAVYWVLCCLSVLLASGFRHRPRQTCLLLLALSLSLLAAEAALRLGYPPSWRKFFELPSRDYHHVNMPDRTMYQGRVEGKDVLVTTNEDGFRTAHSREGFRAHRQRIAVMGDSFAFGQGVRQDRAFPQVMERVLQTRLNSRDLAVLNAGVISYSPLLARRLFDGIVSQYRPTLVLYFLDVTDIGDDHSYGEQLVGWGEEAHFEPEGACPPAYYGALAEVLRLSGVLDHVLRPVRLLESLAGSEPPARTSYRWHDFSLRIGHRLESNRFFIYRHPLERTRTYFESTHGYITALARAAGAIGSGFVLVIVPRFHHWNPKECPENWESEQYALDEPYQYEYFRFFEEKEKESDYDMLDLLPAFRGTSAFPLVFRSDPHWNEDGHAFVAGVLSDYLVATGRVR